MEKQRGYCSYQINIMKLALALVMIKRKPSGISAKEYATRLAVSFNQVQENWKTKCAAVEKELIYVRQRLLEMTLEKELESTTHDTSSQPMESQSQGYGSYTQPQLSCDSTPYDESRDQRLEDVIFAHISFINKMSKIDIKKKLSGVTHCDAKLIIKDTFMATVKALQEQETIFTTLSSAVTTDAVDSIIGIMKSPLFGECKEEMIQCARQLQNKYIARLSGSFCTDFWNKELVEMLCTVILNLSTVAELTEGTVTILMEHIKTCFKMLRDSLTDITELKPSMLDFTAKAFSLLESILKQCQPDQLENIRYIVLNEDGGLPNRLLEEYPLFTYSFWRISSIVNVRCNQCI